jgi:hypothetical protein
MTTRLIPPDTSKQQIRLFRIDQSTRHGTIHGSLTVTSLDEHPEYQALSYTWGGKTKQATIIMDGKSFSIGKNLHDFQQVYLDLNAEALPKIFQNCSTTSQFEMSLWIDQLCIDQSNVVERNHQVQLMAKIYTGAIGVIAWLGQPPKAEPHELYKMEGTNPDERPLLYLAKSKYWSRLWIIQELVLGKQVTILYGHEALAWSSLASYGIRAEVHIWGALEKQRRRSPSNLLVRVVAIRMIILWREAFPNQWLEFDYTSAVLYFSRHKCAEPKDKVYGLLGIESQSPDLLKVDYKRNMYDLFADTIRNIVRRRLISHVTPTKAQLQLGIEAVYRCLNISKPILERFVHELGARTKDLIGYLGSLLSTRWLDNMALTVFREELQHHIAKTKILDRRSLPG